MQAPPAPRSAQKSSPKNPGEVDTSQTGEFTPVKEEGSPQPRQAKRTFETENGEIQSENDDEIDTPQSRRAKRPLQLENSPFNEPESAVVHLLGITTVSVSSSHHDPILLISNFISMHASFHRGSNMGVSQAFMPA